MAFQCKVGTFTIGTGTGLVTVNDLDFTPKLVLLFGTNCENDDSDPTAPSGALEGEWSRGAMTADFQICEDMHIESVTACSSRRSSKVLFHADRSGTVQLEAERGSLFFGGFSINVLINDGINQRKINYIAYGGEYVFATASNILTPSPGDAEDGANSFTRDLNLVWDMAWNWGGGSIVNTNDSTGAQLFFCDYVAALNADAGLRGITSAGISGSSNNPTGFNPLRTYRSQRQNIFWRYHNAAATSQVVCNYSPSYSPEGIRATEVGSPSLAGFAHHIIAMTGVRAVAGLFNSPTSVGSTTVTTTWQPDGVMFLSWCRQGALAIQTGMVHMRGATDFTNSWCNYLAHYAGTIGGYAVNSSTYPIFETNDDYGPFTYKLRATVARLSNGFRADFDYVDTTAHSIVYLAWQGKKNESAAPVNYLMGMT